MLLIQWIVIYPLESTFSISTGTYNLNKTSDLEQYDQDGEVECLFFFWKILLWVFIFFLFGKVSKCTPLKIYRKLDETLTQQINSKQSNFRIQVKTQFNQIRTASIMLLGHLFVFQCHIPNDPSTILLTFNLVFLM